MGKFITILFGVYIVYYVGNIIYDLFLIRDPENTDNEEDVFSLEQDADENNIVPVTIDDVEDIKRPANQEQEIDENMATEEQEEPDINDLRKKYENEKQIDDFNSAPTIEEKIERAKKINSAVFKEMLRKAETSIQVVDLNGQKVYKSAM